jgi:hypothetical protein
MRPSNDDLPPAEEFCSREAEAIVSRPENKFKEILGIPDMPKLS